MSSGIKDRRFRGRLSCRVRPWPFCDGMFSRVGLWPFCVLHVFPCWTPSFLGNRVPKYGKMAEICGCERSSGSISVESTDSDSITPGQNSRFRSLSQNHRSQPQISAIFSLKGTGPKDCFRIRPSCHRAIVPPCHRAWRSSVRFATAWQRIARMRLDLA